MRPRWTRLRLVLTLALTLVLVLTLTLVLFSVWVLEGPRQEAGHGRGRQGHYLAPIYVSSWAVLLPGGSQEANRLARKFGFVNLGQIIPGRQYYHFQHRGLASRALSQHWGHCLRLKKDPKVHWFEQQTLKLRVKRDHFVVPTDPWFSRQWYMNKEVHPDLNILEAWKKGYTGQGVVVSILDDGIEKDHPDLQANYDQLASYDFNDNDPDPQPRYTLMDDNRHGTRCAGEVAAVANNEICGVGVAYKAKIGGVRMLDGSITDIVEAQSLSLQPQHIHIYSASWGPEDDGRTVDGPGVLTQEAFSQGVNTGRSNLGTLFVWASGNGGLHYDNCNCDGYTNSIHTLSVGSTTQHGLVPWYSEACASTLTTTFSSGLSNDQQIVTTDLHHKCTDKHTGTSASAPLAAGMIALALEAKPFDTSNQGYKNWIFMSTHFWDEKPQGIWTLELENKGYYYNFGTLQSYTLILYGTEEDMLTRKLSRQVIDECLQRDTQGLCQECSSPYYIVGHFCLSYCPPRYFNQTQQGSTSEAGQPYSNVQICASCHPSCYTCQSHSAYACTACPPHYTLDKRMHSCSPPPTTSSRSLSQLTNSLPRTQPEQLKKTTVVMLALACGIPLFFCTLYISYHLLWMNLESRRRHHHPCCQDYLPSRTTSPGMAISADIASDSDSSSSD
ncbi:proprotein convertase subtilisin/kexin type 4 isoform X4 [Macrotis lagotis]|uniref:proprotein convertase subtilisin/kexin type 4 isoform X4 n=1 Tax=Macrotis lagotis TaxID=92651 RepID=UPI003D69B155